MRLPLIIHALLRRASRTSLCCALVGRQLHDSRTARIESVQRMAALQHDEIGNIDHVRNWPHPGVSSSSSPTTAMADFHIANDTRPHSAGSRPGRQCGPSRCLPLCPAIPLAQMPVASILTPPRAARSRAIPIAESASPRFGVTSKPGYSHRSRDIAPAASQSAHPWPAP